MATIKPVSVPSWATDANYSSGAESGSSTRLEPPAGNKQQGFLPRIVAPARWWNWLTGSLCDWVAYLNVLPTDDAFVGANFAWTGTHTHAGNVTVNGSLTTEGLVDLDNAYVDDHIGLNGEIFYSTAPSTVTAVQRKVVMPLEDGALGGSSSGNIAITGFVLTAAGSAHFPIRCPRGSVLTAIEVTVSNSSLVSNTVDVAVRSATPDFSVAASGITNANLATATQALPAATTHLFSFAGLSHLVDNTARSLYVVVASTNILVVTGVRATYDDPGPRNG